MLVAALQMHATAAPAANLATARRLITAAAVQGARLIALPEHFSCYGSSEAIRQHAQPLDGPLVQEFAALARDLGIFLLLGTFPEPAPDGKVFNTSVLLGPRGETMAVYRKLHLFDVNLPGRVTYEESRYVAPGNAVVTVPLPGSGFTLGLAICYDLRFPELFRAMVDRGANLIALPSAFALATGRDHWEVLLRARAIENQVYLIAPNQIGEHRPGLITAGRSLIVDPWGLILAQAPDREGFISAPLDLQELTRRRRELPCLQHRRL